MHDPPKKTWIMILDEVKAELLEGFDPRNPLNVVETWTLNGDPQSLPLLGDIDNLCPTNANDDQDTDFHTKNDDNPDNMNEQDEECCGADNVSYLFDNKQKHLLSEHALKIEDFICTTANYINLSAYEDAYDQLILVANSHALTLFRKTLDPRVVEKNFETCNLKLVSAVCKDIQTYFQKQL